MGLNTAPASVQPGDQPGRRRRRGCWLAIALSALMVVLGGGGTAIVLLYLAGEPNSIEVSLNAAPVVAANQTFPVEITIENVSLDDVTISSVGLDEDLIKGVEVLASEPVYRKASTESVLLLGKWRYLTYDTLLRGGDKLVITLTLQATQAGSYSGTVAVWVEGDLAGVSLEQARREKLAFDVQ